MFQTVAHSLSNFDMFIILRLSEEFKHFLLSFTNLSPSPSRHGFMVKDGTWILTRREWVPEKGPAAFGKCRQAEPVLWSVASMIEIKQLRALGGDHGRCPWRSPLAADGYPVPSRLGSM